MHAEFYRKAFLTPKKDCVLNKKNFKMSECGFDCTTTGFDKIASYFPSHYRFGSSLYFHHNVTLIFYYYSDDIDIKKANVGEFWANFTCSGNGYKIYPGKIVGTLDN